MLEERATFREPYADGQPTTRISSAALVSPLIYSVCQECTMMPPLTDIDTETNGTSSPAATRNSGPHPTGRSTRSSSEFDLGLELLARHLHRGLCVPLEV